MATDAALAIVDVAERAGIDLDREFVDTVYHIYRLVLNSYRVLPMGQRAALEIVSSDHKRVGPRSSSAAFPDVVRQWPRA